MGWGVGAGGAADVCFFLGQRPGPSLHVPRQCQACEIHLRRRGRGAQGPSDLPSLLLRNGASSYPLSLAGAGADGLPAQVGAPAAHHGPAHLHPRLEYPWALCSPGAEHSWTLRLALCLEPPKGRLSSLPGTKCHAHRDARCGWSDGPFRCNKRARVAPGEEHGRGCRACWRESFSVWSASLLFTDSVLRAAYCWQGSNTSVAASSAVLTLDISCCQMREGGWVLFFVSKAEACVDAPYFSCSVSFTSLKLPWRAHGHSILACSSA